MVLHNGVATASNIRKSLAWLASHAAADSTVVFFYSGRSHVGIYAGNGKVIHASRPGKPVSYIKMKYMPYAGARRPA